MSDRLPSTGRRPSMSPERIRALLEAYYGEGSPSLEELRHRFTTTNKAGVERPLSLATVRKYLKAAGVELPRGRAAVVERDAGRARPCAISTMMNRIPTEMLIGEGQVKLLVRLLERGETSQKALARQFGVSERRVRAIRAGMTASEEAPTEAPSETEAEVAESVAEAADLPSVEVTDETNVLDVPVVEESAEEASEEA